MSLISFTALRGRKHVTAVEADDTMMIMRMMVMMFALAADSDCPSLYHCER